MLHNLLFYRLVIFNALALVGVYVVYYYGLIGSVIEHDVSHMTEVILGLTGLGVFTALARGWDVSQSINQWKSGTIRAFDQYRVAAKKLPAKNKILINLAETMVILGLVGNAIGFMVALQSKETLISGALTGFGSTVFGLLAALWMLENYWTLEKVTDIHMVDVG
jgi:hypothetical protein